MPCGAAWNTTGEKNKIETAITKAQHNVTQERCDMKTSPVLILPPLAPASRRRVTVSGRLSAGFSSRPAAGVTHILPGSELQ
jgi:hypothetical protein